jgi:hypothetical protein
MVNTINVFESERHALNRRRLLGGLIGLKPLTVNERARLETLERWLLEHPPKGWAYRCKYCFWGTNSSTQECLGCRFS